MSALRSIFTMVRVRPKKLDPTLLEFKEATDHLASMADVMGCPDTWLVCPSCSAFSWRLPPHGINQPCPLIQDAAESAGLKIDAEATAARRMGVHMEEITRIMRQQLGEDEEDGEDE